MKKNNGSTTWLNLTVLLAGEVSTVLGLVVILEWSTRNLGLLQLLPALVALKYNAALGFILCGIGLISMAFGRARLAMASGIAAAVGLVVVHFGIDQPSSELWGQAQSSLSGATLVVGLLMALLLALAVHFSRTARLRAIEAESAKEELKKEINERRRAEEDALASKLEVEKALQVKSAFLDAVSHELRTPLNIIIGNSSIMKERLCGSINSEQERRLATIERSTAELLRMIQGILDVSCLEKGTVPLHLEGINVEYLLSEVRSEFLDLSQRKGVRLEVQGDGLNEPLLSDRMKLKEILHNLVDNAVKFTGEGKVEIKARYLSDGGRIEFDVRDTGIGIKEEKLSHIFDVFYQVDGSSEREFGGMGLGLNIAKKLVELLRGEIRVESEFGKGSTFHVILPREIPPAHDA